MKTERTKELFIEQFRKSLGNATRACKAANINRTTYYKWKEKDPEFRKQCEEILDEQIDFVEDKLKEAIKDGNPKLIEFYLRTIGKKRGYSEKIEIEHTGQVETVGTEFSTKSGITMIKKGKDVFYFQKDENGKTEPISESKFLESIGYIDS